MKLSSGIPKMDEVLDGGLPKNGMVLLLSGPVVDKATFAQQILNKRIKDGDVPVYLTTSSPPGSVKKNFREHGLDGKEFTWIDCISKTVEKNPRGDFYLDMPITQGRQSFKASSENWKEAVQSIEDPKTSVWDNLETFMEIPQNLLEEEIEEWKELLDKTNTLGLFLLTDWGYESEKLEMIKDKSDSVINLGTLEEANKWINFYQVDGSSRMFFKINISGVNLYVPKILVTGPYQSGKSTMVHQLSEKAVSVDRLGTTIALDHGRVESKGMVTDLFGTPGQEKFDWILEILREDTWGLILIIDTSDPDYSRAMEMMEEVKEKDIPFVVFANKQDLEDVATPEEIKENMGFPDVIGTSGKTGKNCMEGLKMLFDKILSKSE